MHSAIAALDDQSRGPKATPQAAAQASQPPCMREARWPWLIVVASTAMAVCGAGAVWISHTQAKSGPVDAAPVLPAQSAPRSTALQPDVTLAALTPPAVLYPAPVELPAPVRENVPVTAAVVATVAKPAVQAVTAPATPPAAPTAGADDKAAAVDSAPAQASPKPVERVPAGAIQVSAATAPAVENVDRIAADIRQAIDAERYDDATRLLQQLGKQLPPESITLLRLRAWHALRSGDAKTSLPLYRSIAERLPDDESASINMALSHWMLGQKDEARRIVAGLAERLPESDAVRQALARFGDRS
ncbi:MAG TPA: tetratricopeptide repeat protein [Noviherbaspirillum sp.]|jgi:hypothetical protein|uniref:tetratricopeptide repeat protein n=1 Tax=Noviherbaspirillum sp. TaxID=1926288 RepID=UPI002DDD67D2|nr:tetratricopeptide repeat protein [Noviherbaspirillum sp.]HEV2612296.1 tetratricopeptide repeat protein [Noviherbaspirillum sp.]